MGLISRSGPPGRQFCLWIHAWGLVTGPGGIVSVLGLCIVGIAPSMGWRYIVGTGAESRTMDSSYRGGGLGWPMLPFQRQGASGCFVSMR